MESVQELIQLPLYRTNSYFPLTLQTFFGHKTTPLHPHLTLISQAMLTSLHVPATQPLGTYEDGWAYSLMNNQRALNESIR